MPRSESLGVGACARATSGDSDGARLGGARGRQVVGEVRERSSGAGEGRALSIAFVLAAHVPTPAGPRRDGWPSTAGRTLVRALRRATVGRAVGRDKNGSPCSSFIPRGLRVGRTSLLTRCSTLASRAVTVTAPLVVGWHTGRDSPARSCGEDDRVTAPAASSAQGLTAGQRLVGGQQQARGGEGGVCGRRSEVGGACHPFWLGISSALDAARARSPRRSARAAAAR